MAPHAPSHLRDSFRAGGWRIVLDSLCDVCHVAGGAGVEPATCGLTVRCTAIVLPTKWIIFPSLYATVSQPSTLQFRSYDPHLQFQARSDLLMRESGSLAVLLDVFLLFIPHMREQKLDCLAASLAFLAFFTGGFRLPPVALLYEARPLAFKPPLGFFPSLRCHAGLLAISCLSLRQAGVCVLRHLCLLPFIILPLGILW